MTLPLVAILGGLVVLAVASDQFVIGAARVALLRRISPLVVGVVIVGFGTSAPELLVSALAAAGGEPEIAIGNIVGSNIANLSLLLGIGAIIVPLTVASRTVLREGPLTVVAVTAFALAVQGAGIGRVQGALLLVAMAAVLFVVVRRSPSDPLGGDVEDLAQPSEHRLSAEVVRTVLGLVGTVGAAQVLLWGAIEVADEMGLGRGFVGATLVAVGTSLPELVTVIQSARRRETDLLVGNLLGSNLFNALAVGGVVGVIGSGMLDAPRLTSAGVIAAIAVATLALLVMRTGHVVTRREGIVLVVAYIAFVPFLA